MGNYGLLAERNVNGEQLIAFYELNDLVVVSAMFPHEIIHRYTRTTSNDH